MMEENIYVVGPEATGISFFGRTKEITDIESIFSSVAAIHLVGPTRIGKSSLVSRVFEKNKDYPNRLCVRMNMGECQDAFDFWNTLSRKIRKQIEDKGLWNPNFEEKFAEIDSSLHLSTWFTDFKLSLQSILEGLKGIGYRLILTIDEFDSAINVFGQSDHYFQLLRSIYSYPDYATSGVIISRRRLHLLETQCPYLSTYHGVFREKTLHAFNDNDMEEFYTSLEMYNINMTSRNKKRLENYTGNIPYLCCMFAERMVAKKIAEDMEKYDIDDKKVRSIFSECLPQINRYYEDLIRRLEDDNHLETISYLSLDSKLPRSIAGRTVENLISMGVLVSEENDNILKYYAYSKDFMTYFRLRPLNLPSWETMTECEKKIKEIFGREFPELGQIKYDDLLADTTDSIIEGLNHKYYELHLRSDKIKRYCEDLSAHKDHPTILDVLTLSDIVNVILNTWDSGNSRFRRYFSNVESCKHKLETIKELRNPMAHAAIEYIDQNELALCMGYCEEIIRLHY